MNNSIAAHTSVVIPAQNEAASIGRVVAELATVAPWQEILVVDDGSADDTSARAAAAGARVIRHRYEQGQGASIKTAVRQAAGHYVMLVDVEGQHPPADALRLAAWLDEYDLVVGSRSAASQATWPQRLGGQLLTRMASYLAGHPVPDLTSAFMAARRDCLLEFLHLLPDGYSAPTTTTLAFFKAGYSVRFEPVEGARSERAGFFLILLKVITIFSPLRIFVATSMAAFLAGAGYAAWTVATQSHVTNSSVLLILLSVVIFLIGLISEQISALRFDGRRT